MSDLLYEAQHNIACITLNRIDKHNAFDDALLIQLQQHLDNAAKDASVRAIILKANGKHFSAGADLNWMQRMAHFSKQNNIQDALVLANVMSTLYHCSKPTIAMVHGHALGGGVGLVAACDIAIAADDAQFCFPEVKLGLIPAVISPYIINAIGERAATWLFMSAETLDAKRALQLNLIHHCIAAEKLLDFTLQYTHTLLQHGKEALLEAKSFNREVAKRTIDASLQHLTAEKIAMLRVSQEGQERLQRFLNRSRHVQ